MICPPELAHELSALNGLGKGGMSRLGMKQSTEAAWERAMKIQEVILRAMARRITWWQAAEIIGISCRQMRHWRRRYEADGYDGLRDRLRGRVSEKRVPLGDRGSGAESVSGAVL